MMASDTGPCTAISAYSDDLSVTETSNWLVRVANSDNTDDVLDAFATTRNCWSASRYETRTSRTPPAASHLREYFALPTATLESSPTSAKSSAATASSPSTKLSSIVWR